MGIELREYRALKRNLNIFDRLKFRNKIIFLVIIQTTLLIVFGIIGFNISFSSYKKQLYEQTSQIVNLLTDNIDNKLKRISDLSFQLMTDRELQTSLMKIYLDNSSYTKLQSSTILKSKLLQYSFSEKYIDCIGVIDLDSNQYFEGINNSYIDLGELDKIKSSFGINDGGVLWIKPNNNDDQILAVRSIRKISDFSFSNMGLLVIVINKKKLIDSKFNYFLKFGYYFSIYSKNSIILEDENGVNLTPLQFEIHDKVGYYFKRINKKNYLINYSTFKYTDWQFVFALPIQKIMLRISQIQIIIIFIYLNIFLFTTYIVISFSDRVAKPLEKLAKNLMDVRNQWFENDDYSNYLSNINFSHSKDKDEIRFLERDFKLLINRINDLLSENYEEKIMKTEWELKALQRQINPHFLYNTLDSIYWLAIIDKKDKISVMVRSLGNLLRNSIYKSESVVTLGEEIEILKDYINIQKLRFEDRLKININIDKTLWSYKIPNLALQTIVENAISHALEVKTDDCYIDVFAHCDNKHITITVIDNGPGVDSERLEMLQNMEIEPGNAGIGLKNIDQRIKIIFGSKYGLFLGSEQGKWFKVDIFIPCKKEV